MPSVDPRDGAFPTLHLTDAASKSSAVLAPSRGGMIIGLELGGRELLYLDRKTFEDPSANVRGGVPVLFPSPGKLTGDAWARGGVSGKLPQHGFARNLPWAVSATSTAPHASATLSLRATEATLAAYPWAFAADYTYRLEGGALVIEMRFENLARTAMPFGAGFHPYFAVRDADKARVRIPTQATRAWDNAQKREVPFSGFDLTANEVDLHLLDHGSSACALILDDLDIELTGSPELTHWVVWTLRGRDFVCVEPWSCPGNALNTGDGLMLLEPGAARTLTLTIARRG